MTLTTHKITNFLRDEERHYKPMCHSTCAFLESSTLCQTTLSEILPRSSQNAWQINNLRRDLNILQLFTNLSRQYHWWEFNLQRKSHDPNKHKLVSKLGAYARHERSNRVLKHHREVFSKSSNDNPNWIRKTPFSFPSCPSLDLIEFFTLCLTLTSSANLWSEILLALISFSVHPNSFVQWWYQFNLSSQTRGKSVGNPFEKR